MKFQPKTENRTMAIAMTFGQFGKNVKTVILFNDDFLNFIMKKKNVSFYHRRRN